MRTPLTSLNLLVKSLREYPLDKEEQEEFLADRSGTGAFNSLGGRIIGFISPRPAGAEDTMMTVDVVPLLRDTLDVLQRRAEDKNIALTWQFGR